MILDNISCSIDNVLECICVKLYLSLKRSIIVSCLHRLPGSTINTTIDFIAKNFSGRKCDLYICGDFNVNLLNYDNHNDTQFFLHSFISLGLIPCVDKPTRTTSCSNTLIDNIHANNIYHSINSGLLIIDITDHLPVFIICPNHVQIHEIREFTNV